jgi:hypothetical protein
VQDFKGNQVCMKAKIIALLAAIGFEAGVALPASLVAAFIPFNIISRQEIAG